MMLPRDIPPEPLKAATRLTRSSGAEVARDTMVRPIIMGLTANITAVDAAPSTSQDDPKYRRTKPRTRIKVCIIKWIRLFQSFNFG
jgi:hypothetical protein